MSEPTREVSQFRYDPEDVRMLGRAQEIVELLQRAVRLNYSITVGPAEMRTLIAILEDARLEKRP